MRLKTVTKTSARTRGNRTAAEPGPPTLTLWIEGVGYLVRRVAGTRTWRLDKLPGPEWYAVSATGCSCPANTFSAKVCKHRAALIATGLVED